MKFSATVAAVGPVESTAKRRRLLALAIPLIAAVGCLTLTPSRAHATDAFNALKGSWSGSGRVSFSSGETEKLKCSARYSGGGSSLGLNVRCASTSAQINLTGSLDASGNKVSGDWSESSYGLNGSANGSASGGNVRLKISGSANGYLTLNVSGGQHTIAMSTQGIPVSGVNVSLARR